MKNKRLLSLFLLIFLIASHRSDAQFRLTGWKTYTSMYEVNSATVDADGNIWAASPGGVFKYSPQSESYELFRNVDALFRLDIKTIRYDSESNLIFAGSTDGTLEIYSPGKPWVHVLDITNAGFTSPGVNDIIFIGPQVYIAGGFGLAVFNPQENVFYENVVRYGDFQKNADTRRILFHDGFIWVATESGVAKVKHRESIADRYLWSNYSSANGLPENSVADIAVINGDIYAAAGNKICKFENDSFRIVLEVEADIISLAVDGSQLYISSANQIWTLDGTNVFTSYSNSINSISIRDNNGSSQLLICTELSGIIVFESGETFAVVPNSPITNGISDIVIDTKGTLWIASDNNVGRGFMKFENDTWTNFTKGIFPEIRTNEYYQVAVHPDNKVFLSSWGAGLLMVEESRDSFNFNIFNRANSPFIGVGDGSFVVVGQSRIDRNKTTWIVNRGWSTLGPVILAYSGDDFYPFYNCTGEIKRGYNKLAIDMFGTKWIGSDAGTGLLYINENRTFDNTLDDECGVIRTSDNDKLIDDSHTALEIDKFGMLWIGTNAGVSVLINPSSVLGSAKPIFRDIRIMRGQKVNDIAVDALNNKWIATNSGIWVLNPDGTELLAEQPINSTNSPLPDDKIFAIESDPENGKIYIGTHKGILQAASLSIVPLDGYDIVCYPQPFSPIADEELTIEGLAPETELRILTLNGELVRMIRTSSRKTIWNGKKENGEVVQSGVYLIVGTSETTEASAVAKIAVIRKN